MMNTKPTSSTIKLTDGQQGVIHAYDVDIAHYKAQLTDTAKRYLDGSYSDAEYSMWNRHYTEYIETLEAERAETLATFEAQNAPAPVVAAPAVEPQTAAYQAAVDNVADTIQRLANWQVARWNFLNRWDRWERRDYVRDLDEQIDRALGRYQYPLPPAI